MEEKRNLTVVEPVKEVKKRKPVNLEDLNLTYIDNTGKVKMIKWGHDYLKWDDKRKIEYLEALASAMNDAARIAYEERDAAWEKVDQLKAVNDALEIGNNQSKELYKMAFEQNNMINQQRIAAEKRVLELEKALKEVNDVIKAN